ncbi:MAG: hypothetical protein K8I82_07610, partial [Anaerolineae bacterium]|nr:hypothetical protein [Anaerolineae bacterium]
MKKSAFRFFMLLVLVLAGCSSKDQESNTPIPPTVLKIAGSGSVATILQAIEADFEKAIPGTNLEILSGTGTGGGVEGVAQGVLD